MHVAAVTADLGSVLGKAPLAASAHGYEQLLDWARGIGVEGTGSTVLHCAGSFTRKASQ